MGAHCRGDSHGPFSGRSLRAGVRRWLPALGKPLGPVAGQRSAGGDELFPSRPFVLQRNVCARALVPCRSSSGAQRGSGPASSRWLGCLLLMCAQDLLSAWHVPQSLRSNALGIAEPRLALIMCPERSQNPILDCKGKTIFYLKFSY